MSTNRCDKCGNLNRYCTCPGADSKRAAPRSPWDVLHDAATAMVSEPTLTDYLMAHLGFTHPDDSLWLCRSGCGVTSEDECGYGGWHGDRGSDAVMLRVVEDESSDW